MRSHSFVLGLVFGIPLYAVSYRDRVTALRQALARAQALAQLKDEACAAWAEVDRSHWTKQRSLGGILGRLVALPVAFWREFLPALGQIVGVPVVLASDADDVRALRRYINAVLDERTKCDTGSSAA